MPMDGTTHPYRTTECPLSGRDGTLDTAKLTQLAHDDGAKAISVIRSISTYGLLGRDLLKLVTEKVHDTLAAFINNKSKLSPEEIKTANGV